MSEPVGNGPRMGDIPNNSNKARKAIEPAAPAEPREKLEKVIEGKVVRRKTPWWKRAAGSMIAEDAGTVGEVVLTDVIIPSVKNLLRDIVVNGIDRTLYGSTRGPSRGIGRGIGGNNGSTLKTHYHDVPQRPRVLSSSARARHRFDEIVLESRQDALDAIAQLVSQIEQYGSASVGDLYDILGESGDWADTKWGWRDLREADIAQDRGGWRLVLPPTEQLNNR